jgi:hypothetical protein
MFWRTFIALAVCVPAYFMAAEPALAHAGHAHHAAAAQTGAKAVQPAAAPRSDRTTFLSARHDAPAPAASDSCGAQCCVCFGGCHSAMSMLTAGFETADETGRAPLETAQAPFQPFGPPDRHDPPPRFFI